MADINLSQSSLQRKESESKRVALNKTLIFSLLLLFATLGASFGLQVYGDRLEQEKSGLVEEIKKQTDLMFQDKVKRVSDFSQRSKSVEKRLNESPNISVETADKVSGAVLSSIAFTSYKYDREKRSIEISAVTNDFKDVAQQVMSFKRADFKSVSLDDATRNKDGVVEFSLTLAF